MNEPILVEKISIDPVSIEAVLEFYGWLNVTVSSKPNVASVIRPNGNSSDVRYFIFPERGSLLVYGCGTNSRLELEKDIARITFEHISGTDVDIGKLSL